MMVTSRRRIVEFGCLGPVPIDRELLTTMTSSLVHSRERDGPFSPSGWNHPVREPVHPFTLGQDGSMSLLSLAVSQGEASRA